MHADPDKTKKRADPPLRLVPSEEHEVILHISLSDIEPLIWRRLIVSDGITLHDLHLSIQGAFGWRNNHLHSFIVKPGEAYSARPSAFDFNIDEEEGDSHLIHLRDLLQRAIKNFRYIYDMGDGWLHKIRIESVQDHGPKESVPVCVDGERHGPVEDCGGSLGYEDLLDAWLDPKHPDHTEAVLRLTPGFNPEQFDLSQTNARIKKMLHGKSR